jgi:hypothetical protein
MVGREPLRRPGQVRRAQETQQSSEAAAAASVPPEVVGSRVAANLGGASGDASGTESSSADQIADTEPTGAEAPEPAPEPPVEAEAEDSPPDNLVYPEPMPEPEPEAEPETQENGGVSNVIVVGEGSTTIRTDAESSTAGTDPEPAPDGDEGTSDPDLPVITVEVGTPSGDGSDVVGSRGGTLDVIDTPRFNVPRQVDNPELRDALRQMDTSDPEPTPRLLVPERMPIQDATFSPELLAKVSALEDEADSEEGPTESDSEEPPSSELPEASLGGRAVPADLPGDVWFDPELVAKYVASLEGSATEDEPLDDGDSSGDVASTSSSTDTAASDEAGEDESASEEPPPPIELVEPPPESDTEDEGHLVFRIGTDGNTVEIGSEGGGYSIVYTPGSGEPTDTVVIEDPNSPESEVIGYEYSDDDDDSVD